MVTHFDILGKNEHTSVYCGESVKEGELIRLSTLWKYVTCQKCMLKLGSEVSLEIFGIDVFNRKEKLSKKELIAISEFNEAYEKNGGFQKW